MKTVLTISSGIVRVAALVVLLSGVSIWFDWVNPDHYQVLSGIHETAGILIGLGLMLVGATLLARGTNGGLGLVSILLAMILPIVGLGQAHWLAGDSDPHWMIQVVHLVLGLGAFALVEIGGTRAKRTVARSVRNRRPLLLEGHRRPVVGPSGRVVRAGSVLRSGAVIGERCYVLRCAGADPGPAA
jgi:hypothetical protein